MLCVLSKDISLGSSKDVSLGSSKDISLGSSKDVSLGSSKDISLGSSKDVSLGSFFLGCVIHRRKIMCMTSCGHKGAGSGAIIFKWAKIICFCSFIDLFHSTDSRP